MVSEECSDQTLTVIGMQLIGLMANGDFDRAHSLFGEEMKAAMSPSDIESAWDSLVEKNGKLQGLSGIECSDEGGLKAVHITCAFSSGSLIQAKIVFKGETIGGLWFLPFRSEYESPEYVDMDAFKELDCAVGQFRLPGRISVPKGEGPFPGLVLVHGSGPNDMDETLWDTKVFKDLAWGLSTRGVAVLRYDKRTRARPDLFDGAGSFTVWEEVVEDAIAAVTLLTATRGVDPSSIYVLGHSLGGMMVPRIASMDETIAGIVIMAGDANKLEDAFLEQIEYLINLDGKVDENEASLLAETKETVKKIKVLDIQEGEHVLGAGRAYWEDLSSYDQLEVGASLNIPILVLQGERDYQVTMEDFEQWMHALSDSEKVTFRSYPDLNHLMVWGEGQSTPQEYTLPGHLDREVVEDIAQWIRSTCPMKPEKSPHR